MISLAGDQELEQGLPTQRRVRVMRELLEIVSSKRLEEVPTVIAPLLLP